MHSVPELLDQLLLRPECAFAPATRLPALSPGLQLPPDLAEFYHRFSEARLFGDPCDPRYHLLQPEEFVPISRAIYRQSDPYHPLQRSWYALAHVQDGNYIAIDCHPDRLGYCYDVFHETADDLSYCKVIARSFNELLDLAAAHGDHAFWLDQDFKGHGYADTLADAPADGSGRDSCDAH